MTRINCVPVEELCNEHLLAEYKELPRISGAIWRWHEKTTTNIEGLGEVFVSPTAPDSYCMGKGHVKFFYDKGEWLRRRFEEEIVPELERRGYNLSYTSYRPHPDGYNLDWVPDENAKEICRERIKERLKTMKKATFVL